MHCRVTALERQKAFSDAIREQQQAGLTASLDSIDRLWGDVQRLCAKLPEDDQDAIDAAENANGLRKNLVELLAASQVGDGGEETSTSRTTEEQLPPAMVSTMTSKTVAAKDFLEDMQVKRAEELKAKQQMQAAARRASTNMQR